MMGGVTCPNCGKDNPDFLDNCQFCQAVLRTESTLNIGEGPTKKTTGELEGVLPDWLRDARQQGRDSAEEEAKKEATKPRIPAAEPPDLLAGLAFQAASDEDEVPDWLAAINPVEKKTPAPPASKAAEEKSPDFFAQFNAPAPEPVKNEPPKDELTGWMAQTNKPAEEPLSFDFDSLQSNELSAPVSQEPDKPAEPEDLSWLHNLESSSKQSGTSAEPQADMGWLANLDSSSVPSSDAHEDLSWLNNLGGMPAPSFNEPAPAQPASSQEDLSWLNSLGGMPAPSSNEPAPSQPASSPEDLSWLNNLGGTPVPSSNEQAPAQPASSQEDLSWLNNLGGAPIPSSTEPASMQPVASQNDLDWLNNLGGTPDAPAQPASSQEDLGWLNNLDSLPSSNESERAQPASSQEDLSWLNSLGSDAPAQTDAASASSQPQEDLSWLSNLGGTPASSFNEPAPVQPASSQEDLSWLNNLGSDVPAQTDAASASSQPQEDLSWLSNLGGTPAAPSFNEPAPAQPASSQEDLSWLNSLGSDAPAQSSDISTSSQPQEDLSWLNNLGNTSTPVSNESAQPVSSQEDLDWLNNLSGAPAAPSFDEPVTAPPASSQEDLAWLNSLGGTTSQSSNEPEKTQLEESDWLKNVGIQKEILSSPDSFLSPRHTAPLSEEAANSMPDWLRSAAEESASMPPLGAASMDWLDSHNKSTDDVPVQFDNIQSGFSQQVPEQTQSEPAPLDPNILAPLSGANSSLSNQDIDSLFDAALPDWLSQPGESGASAASSSTGIPASLSDDSLSPVNLPSWVQAMRPVEAAISDVSAVTADQNTEREGPLAGLRGVIPLAPIGSALRPKSISLKLQATDEQQTTAALLERIVASETIAQPLKTAPFVASQRILRWTLAGLFLIVLGVIIGTGSQFMPISVSPPQMNDISNMAGTIQSIPANAPLLVVIDYEPALASELEAAAGPLLDQLAATRHPNLTFISNSPNGSALAERLMTDTKINKSTTDNGLGYQLNSDYFNIGYLPGGSAGVNGFVAGPKDIMPAVNVNQFSDFAAVIVITDHAESGQVWIEQVELMKQSNPALAKQPLLVAASAQAGPLLEPYVSSKQVNGMVSGLSDAARYEFMNNSRPGMARSYWDAFGTGLMIAVLAIILGSLWSLFANIRARRTAAEQG